MPSSRTTADEPSAFDLYSYAIDADPFPYYERLREEFPCYWSDRNGIWILTRYEDVLGSAQDWATFSSAQGNMIDELPGRAGATLGTTDPPRHDRLRNLARTAFLKRNLEQLAEPTRQMAQAASRQMLEQGSFDFIADFASPITVGVLCELMGLPRWDPVETRRKVVLSISTDKSLRGRNEQQVAAFRELGQLIAEQVELRRAQPRDDLISTLTNTEVDGDRLTPREVVLTSATFVMAGVESLSSFMSMLALNLHDNPDERHRLLCDPGLMAPAIEESLRFNTSAQRFKRVATRDVVLHGQRIRAGDTVALAYGAANRDWRKFPNPDRYDITRRPTGHLGFGAGRHVCLGSTLARMVTAQAMQEFLRAVPHFALTSRPEWISSSNFRSPVALPFECRRPTHAD
jgi:cytochrome P450